MAADHGELRLNAGKESVTLSPGLRSGGLFLFPPPFLWGIREDAERTSSWMCALGPDLARCGVGCVGCVGCVGWCGGAAAVPGLPLLLPLLLPLPLLLLKASAEAESLSASAVIELFLWLLLLFLSLA